MTKSGYYPSSKPNVKQNNKKELMQHDINPQSNTLPLEMTMKLKVFAILSLHKDIPAEMVVHKMFLSLVAGYEAGNAVFAAQRGIETHLQDPADYRVGFIVVYRDADSLIQFPEITQPPVTSLPVAPETKKEKSIEELSAYVRYIFAEVGTPKQQEVAEKVLLQFKNVKGGKTKTS